MLRHPVAAGTTRVDRVRLELKVQGASARSLDAGRGHVAGHRFRVLFSTPGWIAAGVAGFLLVAYLVFLRRAVKNEARSGNAASLGSSSPGAMRSSAADVSSSSSRSPKRSPPDVRGYAAPAACSWWSSTTGIDLRPPADVPPAAHDAQRRRLPPGRGLTPATGLRSSGPVSPPRPSWGCLLGRTGLLSRSALRRGSGFGGGGLGQCGLCRGCLLGCGLLCRSLRRRGFRRRGFRCCGLLGGGGGSGRCFCRGGLLCRGLLAAAFLASVLAAVVFLAAAFLAGGGRSGRRACGGRSGIIDQRSARAAATFPARVMASGWATIQARRRSPRA